MTDDAKEILIRFACAKKRFNDAKNDIERAKCVMQDAEIAMGEYAEKLGRAFPQHKPDEVLLLLQTLGIDLLKGVP